MKYYLSIDQGTTGTTAMLIDKDNLSIVAKVNFEFKQHYPKPGWVEHDLDDIWNSVKKSVTAVLNESGIDSKCISAIGITNQRETTCAFNKKGDALCHAIVWQDRRTHDRCLELKDSHQEVIRKKTGLPTDPYFSASKIEWLINNNNNVSTHLNDNDCLFGTIDTFLIYKLTGAESHVTEPSNASRTLLYNINEDKWDEDLLHIFSIPNQTLPKIKNSFDNFGKTNGLSFLTDSIPITGCLGDQQAALFGQTCFHKGESKCTYGTGAFFLMNTGGTAVYSKNGLLTTVAYKINGEITYALEGSSYIAGAAVQWLRDNLNVITHSSDIEKLAKETTYDKVENILFLPFFTGIASPYWQSDAQAAIIGLTRDSGKPEIAQACLEGICLSINDLLLSVKKDSGLNLRQLKVDGGACANNHLMTLQSSFSQIEVVRPEIIETTAYGASLAAAVGLGDYKISELKNFWNISSTFTPDLVNKNYYQRKKDYWTKMIKKIYL